MFLYLLCVILFASALVQTAPTELTAINFNDERISSTVSEPVMTLKASVVNETINLATKTSEAQTLDSSLEYMTVSRNVESSGEIITETPEASPGVFKTDTDEIIFIDTVTPVDEPIVSTLKPYTEGATVINFTEIPYGSTIISKIDTNGETAAKTPASGAQTNLYTLKPMSNEEISSFTYKITTEASQTSSSAEINITLNTQAPTIFTTSESSAIKTSTFTPEITSEAQIDFSTSKLITDDAVSRSTTESITEKPTTEAQTVSTTEQSTTDTKTSTLISEFTTETPTTEAQIDFSTPKSITDDVVSRSTTESITEKPTREIQTVSTTQQSTTEIITSTFSSELTTDSPTTESQIDFSTSKSTTDDVVTRLTTESVTEKPTTEIQTVYTTQQSTTDNVVTRSTTESTTDIKTSTVISEITTETPTTEAQTSFTSEPTTNIKTTSFTPEITTEIPKTLTTQPEATTNAIPTELTLAEIFIKILQALSQSATSQSSKTSEASTPPTFTYTPYNFQFVLKSRTTNSCNWYQVRCTNYSPFDNNNYCTYTLIGDCNEYKPYQILAAHQIVQPSYYSYLFNYQYIYQQQTYHQCNLYQVRCVFYSLIFDQFDYCNNEYLGSCSS
ncbi:mucin-2 [Microplitis demolitor]|uniref:mucin-2 n=1 Tax=Microplitis demolitor TaxID=69319 RepID=UPI0004CD4DE1|nr:mucin-2 [Microplitis demolitor]